MADGQACEDATRYWLEAQGCRTLARNYRWRGGEIDLIMRLGSRLLFVEVRARSNPRYASAAESVDGRKQARLRRTASHYLACRWRGPPPPCRFDVVVWEPAPHSGKLRPRWIENAF